MISDFREGVGIGSEKFEAFEMAAARRVNGGVRGVSVPFDEEGEQAAVVVVKIESFPLEQLAVGTLAGAGSRAIEGQASGVQTCCEVFEIARMRSPADKARLREFLQAETVAHSGLSRIGSDDFEITARVWVVAAEFAETE